MATKIKSVTIVSNLGVSSFFVGYTYNELLLAEIKDESDAAIIYRGYTFSKELIFEAINAPIEVTYCPA